MKWVIRVFLGVTLGVGLAATSVTAKTPAKAPSSRSEDQAPTAIDPTPPSDETTTSPAESQSSPEQSEPQPAGKVSAEDLLKAFQKERPTQVPIEPSEVHSDEALETPAGSGQGEDLLPDGFFLVDRAGRVSKEGQWYVFSFEGYNESHPEPPLKLLPNQLLERMLIESEDATNSVVFVASGEVTVFRGENYLLLRKLLRRRSLGNLQK